MLAHSIMLTILGESRWVNVSALTPFSPGSPVLYYADEVGRQNDNVFAKNYAAQTGINDPRYAVRGPMNWESVEQVS